jgi:hypothetical protein
MRHTFITLVSLIVLAAAVDCRATTFDLLSRGTNLPSPLTITADGITLTLSGASFFNSLPNSFGIDSMFLTTDDPNLVDSSETMFFKFDQPVFLDSVVISQFDSQDSGELLLKAANVVLPLANGSINAAK